MSISYDEPYDHLIGEVFVFEGICMNGYKDGYQTISVVVDKVRGDVAFAYRLPMINKSILINGRSHSQFTPNRDLIDQTRHQKENIILFLIMALNNHETILILGNTIYQLSFPDQMYMGKIFGPYK